MHGEAQTVGLARTVVGILADDHHFNLIEISMIEGVEDFLARRVHGLGLVFGFNKFDQIGEIGFFKLGLELFFPGRGYFYVCRHYYISMNPHYRGVEK